MVSTTETSESFRSTGFIFSYFSCDFQGCDPDSESALFLHLSLIYTNYETGFMCIIINTSDFFVTGRCCVVFWEKCKSLIEILKIADRNRKICIFLNKFSVLLLYENKMFPCIQHDHLIKKNLCFVCTSANFWFEILQLAWIKRLCFNEIICI